MKKIAIIGATGSIGKQALDIIERHPDLFQLTLISAHENQKDLVDIANRFKVPYVCLTGENGSLLPTMFHYPCCPFFGKLSLPMAIRDADFDILLNAAVGIAALDPLILGMEKGARIALANKESLVCAGEYIMNEAKKYSAEIIPVDSEHSAIFQCLSAGRASDVESLVITASGGALRDVPLSELDQVPPSRALEHPNWTMGKKITIDSATMINKAFEVIEAHYLFGIPYNKIETVLHKESIVHSMVRFADGSLIAQLAEPDMRLPIQYAFTYPERIPSPIKRLEIPYDLTFRAIDFNRYPCFAIMLEAANRGGLYPAALHAADTILVDAYLSGIIKYSDIPVLLEKTLNYDDLYGSYDYYDVRRITEEVERYTTIAVYSL